MNIVAITSYLKKKYSMENDQKIHAKNWLAITLYSLEHCQWHRDPFHWRFFARNSNSM